MNKILISIRPQWVAKILNGEKTIEIRKSAPKDLPCEVYIYCTNGREVIKPSKTNPQYEKIKSYSPKKGCVCAKFTLNKVDKIENDRLWQIEKGFLECACLSFGELACYLSSKTGYAWHIDNLVIFDKPKELKDFKHPIHLCPLECDNNFVLSFCKDHCKHNKDPERLDVWCDRVDKWCEPLTRAPQSWCYIETEKNE